MYVGAFYSLSQTFGLPALPAAQGHSGWNRSPYSLPFVILPVPARSPFRFIRHRRRSTPNPARGGAFGCGINTAYRAVHLRGAIVSMGLRGVQGGPKGRNRNLPWPPAKKYKEACSAFCLFNSLRKFAYSEFPAPSKREPLVRFTPPCTISAGRQCVKCSKIVYRLCNHMVYSFDILKASQKKRKRWRWLGRKGLWK